MAAGGHPTYEVDHLPQVVRQIGELNKKAIAAGIKSEYVAALENMVAKLQNEPVEWGDPEWHPKKAGSSVRHGISDLLFVQYAVFELERKVLILKIKAMPSSPLAD
jgi:hypothetical protein